MSQPVRAHRAHRARRAPRLTSLALLALSPLAAFASTAPPAFADAPYVGPSDASITVAAASDTAIAPPPLAAAVVTPAAPASGFAYGMQAHLYYQNVPAVLGLVQDAGFGWVKQQVRWADVEPIQGAPDWAPLDQIVDSAATRGVRVLFSVVSAPAWSRADGRTDGPPDDPAALADFMGRLATRYAGRVAAYEVWNEQNLSREWGAAPTSAGSYVELLKAAYPAVKAADPSALVISGALTPTGLLDPSVAIDDVLYLQQMYAYQDGVIRTVTDAIGAHAGGFNNPPDDQFGQPTVSSTTFKDHPSFYFRRIEQVHDVMAANGDGDKKVWVTEVGWSTANTAPGYEYGADNSDADQAQYLVRAFQLAHDYGWVGGMFVWNVNFEQVVPPVDEKYPFGIVAPDGTPRPAYTALQQMVKLP